MTIAPPIRPVDRNHKPLQGETPYGRLAGHGYRAFATAGLCTLLATALSLTACGGNDDDTQAEPATSVEASASEQAVATEHTVTQQAKSTKAYASKTSPPLPDLPNGVPREGTQSCGTDERYYKDNTHNTNDYEERALVNRHVSCESHLFTIEVVEEDKNVPGSRKTLGWASGLIYLSVHGPSNVLQKQFDVRFELRKWEKDAANTANPNPTLRFGMRLLCNPDFAAPGLCTPGTGEATLRAEIPAPGFFPSTTVTIPVNYAITAQPGKLPIAQFDQSVQFVYAVSGSVNNQRYAQDLNVEARLSTLRCDNGVAQVATVGCVFKKAAPVYVLRADDMTVSEAAIHIREAQAHGSPGKFVLKPDTWAIADPSVVGDQALQRLKNTTVARDTNRAASCRSSTALIKTRVPVQTSLTCTPNGAGCECDEYPFASTWNGGYFDPQRTSVRWINGTQNQAAGSSKLSGFYRDERVIDPANYPNDTLPENRYENGPGDDFWVHVPTQ